MIAEMNFQKIGLKKQKFLKTKLIHLTIALESKQDKVYKFGNKKDGL